MLLSPFTAALGAALLLVGCSSPSAPRRDASLPARAAITASASPATSNTLPLHFIRSNECTGETVEITGTIHLVSQMRADGSVVGHFNYQRVTGIGLTSGTTYRVTAVDQVHLSPPFPSSLHSVQRFRMIATAGGPDLLVNALTHITVTPNGDVTASIAELTTSCVGD